MEESEDNLSSEDIRFDDSPSIVKVKTKKRSLVERELETNLTARVTSPVTNTDATSTSRYGRARRLKTEYESTENTPRPIKSPKLSQSPNKIQSPVYKMHASNSIRIETPNKSLENQIETIYNENMSLSRFGSDEKKAPSTKYPKVYIRKDLIQTKEKDEEIVLIKNMFSPMNNKKSLNSDDCTEKYVTNKQNGYTNTASVVKTLDFDGNKKKIDKKMSKNELFDLEALCEYQVGDLVWARMGTYPFWPCIITREPLSGMYVRKKLFGRIERDVLHVTFFGDNGRRGWIVDNMLRKFLGQLEFETARMNVTPEAKKKDPRWYGALFISEKKLAQWQISVEEAELLLKEPKRLRIDMLNSMLEKSISSKVTPKQEKSKRVTRTNSDVSLSESLYDTLFSEKDFKTKDYERSRSKSKNRSLDVSEVVTACLDNMAAKTGITKIQRQSHMDRWLQKAKSKTPEKSHMKSQTKGSKKNSKEQKKTYNFRSSSQESLEDSKLPAYQNEHNYSQKYIDSTSSVIYIDEEENTEETDSLNSSGLGIISKVESLCEKNEIHENDDMILTVVDNEIFISDAGNIDNVDSIDSFISDGSNVAKLQNGDILNTLNNDSVDSEEQNVEINISNDKVEKLIDDSNNDNCMDVNEYNTNVDQVENIDLNVTNCENLMIYGDYIMDDTKMSVDEDNAEIHNEKEISEENNDNAEQIDAKKEQTNMTNDFISKISETDNKMEKHFEGNDEMGNNTNLVKELHESEENKNALNSDKSDNSNTSIENKTAEVIDNENASSLSNNVTDRHISIENANSPVEEIIEASNLHIENTFFEFNTIESNAKIKSYNNSTVDSLMTRDASKKSRKFKLSLNKSIEKSNDDAKEIEKSNTKAHLDQNEPNTIDEVEAINACSVKYIESNNCENKSTESNLQLDVKENGGALNGGIFEESDNISSDKKIAKVIVEPIEMPLNEVIDSNVKISIKSIETENIAVQNGFHEEDILSIDTKTDKTSLNSEFVLNGYPDNNVDADTNSIEEEETLADYQVKLKAIQIEGKEITINIDKIDKLNELDLDNMSIKSEDSEVSVGRRKRKEKLIEKKQFLDDPEFIKYLEMRQDAVMDEHPELSQEDITNYLYNTWIYEEGLKTEAKKADEIDQSNLVKGLNQDPVPVKKIRKKIKVEKGKEKEMSIEKEVIPKEKSKRRIIRPYYKEDFSDFDDDIEYYEIFKPKRKEPLKIESAKVKTEDLESKDLKLEIEIVNETPIEVDEYASDGIDQVEEYFNQLTASKPNLFKGLIREKVCEICEKFGYLHKCKGCHGMFHLDCINKVTKVIEVSIPSRGRKKKKRNRGRKAKDGCLDSESQSDEKSQDTNVSEELQNMSLENEEECHITANEDDFESKLCAKMKELLENQESIEYDSGSNDEHDFSDINYGECKIIDIKRKKREQTDYSDFKCNNCQKYDIPLCFVCKYPISPKDKAAHRQKCSIAHCNKYYHMECLDHWPQTQFNGGESRSNKMNEYFEAFSCPRHVCHTCVCDDPRGCKTRFSGDKLARCVRCPATYHTFTKCLPAGSQILSGSHIICPRHYEHRPGKVPCHVNTGWCFICALGGSLICCEYCPTSFHAECLNIKPPEGGYMCEDCETGRLPLYGEMVWVKLGHYRWWPGIILHPSEIPQNILSVKHSQGEFVVRFFGQYDHYWVNRGRVFPFQEGDSGKISSQKSKIDAAFTMAMEHAQRACEILKKAQPNEEESQDIASSLRPPHYVKLRANRAVGALAGAGARRPDAQEGSLTQCECGAREPLPCGPYSQCLNRMLLTECGPTCRAGDNCNNRAFEKRLYPKLTPYRTPHRGWGLKTLEDVKAGQFVIEYVGELIDEEEFQRRMRRKHEVRDENFYFLTLDKERVIDAGPKGNLARFMNHSCEPNCETQKWTVLGDIRVGLFALYDIPANSELTFNYNLESAGIEKKQCMCGAKRCSGYIGAKPKQDDQPKKNKLQKRVYKKRPKIEDSPSTSQKPKNRIGRPYKPRELTDIEKDLLIIKNATSLSSDSECSGRLSSLDSTKDNRSLKRKKIFDDVSPKRIKMEFE